MRNAVVGSGVAHVLLVAVLLVMRGPVSIVVPGPDVVQVALVDPSAPIMPAVAPAPEPPEPEPEAVKPVEDTGVKLEHEKPKKKPPEKRERTPPSQQEVSGLPGAKIGNSGLKGDVSVEAGNFEFTYYLILVRNKIASNWMAPAGVSTQGSPVRAVVYFRIGRGGELDGIRLESSSGVEFFDRSAVRAVTISDPLPPLPLGFAGGQLGVHFGFEWESP